jgi:NADPH2:quinone reductase
MMKAIVYYENGGPEVLKYEDVAEPVCPPTGVVVAIEAISIEGGDIIWRKERPLPMVPFVAGSSAVGTVTEVGHQASGYKVGDRVATIFSGGAYAERRAMPLTQLVWTAPQGLNGAAAATVLSAFCTADECLFDAGGLKANETVLIHAGASGVGMAAIQLAKRAGARVLATASDDQRLARLKELGLDDGINYRRDNFIEIVMRLTDGNGADLILDSVGGANLQTSLEAVRKSGRIVFFGNAGGGGMTIDLWPVLRGNITLRGVDIGAKVLSDRVHAVGQKYLDEAARGEIQVLVDRRFPLAQAAKAHAYVESRAAVGRVVLIP